mgnify:FL=1
MDDDSSIMEYVDDDRRAEVAAHVDELLDEMSLEEKAGQLTQENAGFLTGTDVGRSDFAEAIADGEVGSLLNVESIEDARKFQEIAVEESPSGVPLLLALDVIHGYRTLFPMPLAEAAAWDPDLAERTADVAATEAAACGVHWTFAPGVDVTRDPRWGRILETSGEDTLLTSEYARARVRGFQGDDLAADDSLLACAKHYAGYGASEAGREYNTVDVSETTMRETHLPPFEAAVDEGVGTVMNAFNVHERIPASGHEELIEGILRDELGFEGFLISDWNSFGEMIVHGAAEDREEAAEKAITAGSEMDMVSGVYTDHLADLVREGRVSEERVDEAVRRILELKGALGLFEDPYRYFDEERAEERVLTEDHRALAREAVAESQVLLENDGTLPLDADDSVALVGTFADSQEDMMDMWDGDASADDVVTLRSALEERCGDLTYATGYERDGTVLDEAREEAVAAAEDADVVVAAVGEPGEWGGEGASRAHLDLPGDQAVLVDALAETGTPVAAVCFTSRPLIVPDVAETADAVLESWFPGTEAGPGVADVLLGERDPGGRLPVSVPVTEGQIPVYYDRLSTGRPVPDDIDLSEPPGGPGERFHARYVDVPNDPLYHFGHGESYADVSYVDWSQSTDEIGFGESLAVSVTLENESERAGTEVVQVYAHDRTGSRARPVKELVGYAKVRLEAGERREVSVDVDAGDLAFWTAEETWEAEPGEFDLYVGRSAGDVVFESEFELAE